MTHTLEQVRELDTITANCGIIQKWLGKALTKAHEYRPEDIYSEILKGYTLLFLSYDKHRNIVGIVTAKCVPYPTGRTMLIHLLGGKDIHEWVHNIEIIEDTARQFDCVRVEIKGRPAWKKLLPEYKTERIILTKELT